MIGSSYMQLSVLNKRELYAYVAGYPPAHACWGICCIFDRRRPRQALAFVTNIHKAWMKKKTRNKI